MKILHILPSIDPKGGGPMEGVRQMGTWLKEQGHSVDVATLDDSAAPFIGEFPLPVYALGPSKTSYRYNAKLTAWLMENAKNYDSVIINGLWQYHGLGAWRALRHLDTPYFVFTHGMLDPWFREAYPLKNFKKWIYWKLAEYKVLRDASSVIFTCEEERILARDSFRPYSVNEAVTSYGTRTPPQDIDRLRKIFYEQFSHLKDKKVFLFLSRIHQKKGLDLLISAFSKVAECNPDLHLMIAGPDQENLMEKLKSQADQLGITDQITWPGMLQGDMKWAAFHSCEAFVLTSHQENFGIAVAEALGCGKPVLISNKINIWREIEQDFAGIVGNDDADGAFYVLNSYMQLSAEEKAKMAINAYSCFNKRYTVEAMVCSLLRILENHV